MSENYRALTRKYRPQNFEDIVSQDHVSSTLMNAIKQNRLSHAYMFCGPRGVGKTTMARVLARTINEIDNSVDGESLNQTLNVVEMDAASNNKVDDVHHLRETVRIPPQNGRYKVFIVDEVHMLSKAAFNALLKTLEEPPEHAIFIFATTEPHKVLPTILSRVQRFDFKRIAVDEIVRRLRKISADENISIDDESLHVIAKKADGALRDALGLMDQAIAFCGDTITHNELVQALNVVGTDRLFQFMNCVKEHDADQGLELINTLLQEGYDIQEFLIGLTEHLRNLYIAHHSKQLYMVEASEETKSKYKQFASDFSRDDLMRMLHLVSEAQIKIKDANQPRIQFEITLLKLIHMERSESLAKLLSDLEEVKKNSKNLASLSSPESKPAVQEKKNEDPATEPAKENENAPAEESSSVVKEELPSSEQEPEATKVIDDEFDIGTPALQTRFSQVNEASKEEVKTEIKVEATTQHSQEAKNLQIEDIKSAWPEFIDSLNGSVSSILKMQTERALPVKLKGTELSLECDNQLAKTMLDEQAKELAGKLHECIGVALRFNVEVSQKIKQTKARNPYERFKEIQQKDPMIRSLVERFGAELEY
ncbi:DNA polymerase III, subunit gamma and tau [Balneola sp. EhC07]|uniref:DNA polymerase III subunit gamma/tau n=1 Tax=Balneola sp. EhC07 TaxID=1849360 RepID=UPI0007F474D5|nr:DNA polymerase III subunit gamma/tau [Balneola sp. EhC07]OAN61271.1 DNA polymerase III, subunit gamma and tau [Balneola sp. EhC07]